MKTWQAGCALCLGLYLLGMGAAAPAFARTGTKSILGWIPFAKGYSYKILEGHPGSVILAEKEQHILVYVFQSNEYAIGYGLTQVPIVVDERCIDTGQSMDKCKRRQWTDIVVDRSQQRGLPPNRTEMTIRHPIRAREVLLQCLAAGGRVQAELKVQTTISGETSVPLRWAECASIEVREANPPTAHPATRISPMPLP